MSQGIAPISLVPVPRVGNVTLPRAPVLRGLLAVARLGLAALLVVTMVAGFAVAMGRTDVPLQALAAVRSPVAVPALPAEAPPARSVVAAPVLKVGTVMNLPLGGVATEARTQSATVVGDILARQAAERAAAAARAAERRAAAQRAAAKAAAERAAAQKAAAQRAAAAERAAAQKAAAQRAAAAQQAAAQQQAAAGAQQAAAGAQRLRRPAARRPPPGRRAAAKAGPRQTSSAEAGRPGG